MLSKIRNMFKLRRQQVFFLDTPNDINAVSVVADFKLSEITFDNVEHVKDFRSEEHAAIHYCNVSESHRGKNIYPTMLAALCQRLFSEVKVRRVLIDTEDDNKAALQGIAKVGFKPLGKGTYIQFGGRLIYKYEQLKPCNTTRGEER
jgi:RimJ/RimL family protein N-acetyltransferase